MVARRSLVLRPVVEPGMQPVSTWCRVPRSTTPVRHVPRGGPKEGEGSFPDCAETAPAACVAHLGNARLGRVNPV